MSLSWLQSSHQIPAVSSSDKFWWILIRDRLGVPTRAAVLETLVHWPRHPTIPVWPTSNPLKFWILYILLASNMSILRTKCSLITPGAMMKRSCVAQSTCQGVIIFYLIESIATYQPKIMTFLLHINRDSVNWHPIMASAHTHVHTHTLMPTCAILMGMCHFYQPVLWEDKLRA